jgi:hypothetical protein
MLLSTTLLALLASTAEGSRWSKRQMAGVVDTGVCLSSSSHHSSPLSTHDESMTVNNLS